MAARRYFSMHNPFVSSRIMPWEKSPREARDLAKIR
jgi:hypothetical protein